MIKKENFIMNEKIRYPELRIVSSEGEQMGVMPTQKALALSRSENLDLVVITEQASPPVAKIVDYSKFKYELSKKAKENAKKNRINKVELKEITLRLNTDTADVTRLQNRSKEWINKGHKVKINLQLKGRENHNRHVGRQFISEFIEQIPEAVIEGNINDAAKGLQTIIYEKK